MKTVQKYWVLSLFMVVGLVFAGCGDSTGTDDKKETTPAAGSGSDEGGDDKSDDKEGEGSADNASTNAGNGEFQLVSLNVPNMT